MLDVKNKLFYIRCAAIKIFGISKYIVQCSEVFSSVKRIFHLMKYFVP